MAKVKVSIPTLNDRIKKLEKFDNIVFKVTTRLRLLLFQNFENGKGADGKKFKELSEKPFFFKLGNKFVTLEGGYKEFKAKKGRTPIRNLLLSGNMLQDLDPVKKQDFKWILKFKSGRERKKALGNVEHAPNMMNPISERINKKLQRLAFKEYTR